MKISYKIYKQLYDAVMELDDAALIRFTAFNNSRVGREKYLELGVYMLNLIGKNIISVTMPNRSTGQNWYPEIQFIYYEKNNGFVHQIRLNMLIDNKNIKFEQKKMSTTYHNYLYRTRLFVDGRGHDQKYAHYRIMDKIIKEHSRR